MSLRHAILGFLAHAPMTGYELKKHMGQSVAHFWPADQAQIYRTLTALVRDGLISVETEAQAARPNKQVHSVLPEGLAELDRWLVSPLDITASREPFLLRLFFVGRLGRDAVMALLRARIDEAIDLIAALEAIPRGTGGAEELSAWLRFATLDNGLAHAQAEKAWAEVLLWEMEKENE